jgi:DNA-directed RNA polymerase specialized sigma24 family protein
VVQDTLCEAHREFDCFRGQTETELRCWLRRALLNNLEDRTRSFAGTSKRCIGSEVPLEHVCSWSLVDRELTPMAEIAAREDAMRLERALLRLPHD